MCDAEHFARLFRMVPPHLTERAGIKTLTGALAVPTGPHPTLRDLHATFLPTRDTTQDALLATCLRIARRGFQ